MGVQYKSEDYKSRPEGDVDIDKGPVSAADENAPPSVPTIYMGYETMRVTCLRLQKLLLLQWKQTILRLWT